MMRTIAVWIGAVLMAGGLWSASVINQGLADEPAAPNSSSEATGGAAGKGTGGSEAIPPVVEGEPALSAEAGQVQEQTVSLTQAVHFTDAKGEDVVVGPGSYRVEAEGTNRIRLLPAETGESVMIEATSLTHQQTVESPVPVTVSDPQQPDVLYLALYLPDGQGIGAIGTYSGVKSRAVRNMSAVLMMQIAPARQFTATAVAPSVVIYEHPNFGGRSQTLGVGGHILSDFNDIVSSIKVPAGLVALLFEQVDAGGGYGLSVDVLEDRPDLSQVNFNDKVSYVCVISSPTPQGFIWSRASVQNGQFLAGHWERQRASGTPVNITAVVSPPLPPHPPGVQPAPCAGGPIVRDQRPPPPPASILETTYRNPPFDTSKQSWPHWAKEAVHGKTMFPDWADVNIVPIPLLSTRQFSSPDYSKNEWTQLLNQDEDYEVDLVGLSGRAIIYDLDGKNGDSGHDVPFTHPFGPDWEFYIAPDDFYKYLAAPPAPPPDDHKEYAQSVIEAKHFNLDVVNTLGVETDHDLIPLPYRPQHGDRVAVWGRWIVDTGHSDFHTEIHPPLLLATGRATSPDETTTTVIGRPYLVGQRWPSVRYVPGGPRGFPPPQFIPQSLGMIDHLLEEADKVPYHSRRVEAHPQIMPNAWQGTYWVSYTVKPPSPRKIAGGPMSAVAADRLMVSFHFTVRTGVAVQVVNSGDAVTVNIVMNGNINKRAPLPPRHDVSVSKQMLADADPRAGTLYSWKELKRGVETLGVGAAILAEGVLTDRYDAPYAHSVHDGEIIHVPVDSLSGNTPFSVDDGQPFPIYGKLTLTWERGGGAGGILRAP
jgi:hypothetical protein